MVGGLGIWNSIVREHRPDYRLLSTTIAGIFALLLIHPYSEAHAEKVVLDNSNIGSFQLVQTSVPFFTCFSTASSIRIGTLNSSNLASGNIWLSFDIKGAQKKKNALSRKANYLKRKKNRKSKSQLQKLKAQLAWWTAAIGNFRKAKQSCEQVPPVNSPTPPALSPPAAWEDPPIPAEGEFIGNAASLLPYREKLTPHEVRHLLDKVAFGGSAELYQIGIEKGLTAIVDALVNGLSSAEERQTLQASAFKWASKAFYKNEDNPELRGVLIWTTEVAQIGQLYRTIFSRDPLREWMLLQLSAHFAVNLNQVGFSYSDYYGPGIQKHWELLQRNSLGNIRLLAKDLLLDPAMNFWLNNKDNRAGEPNQNFGRELLELFLLGAIDPVTHVPNYGEESIVAATAYLSGYSEITSLDPNTGRETAGIAFFQNLHDTNPYEIFPNLSSATLYQTLSPNGVIDHILDRHPSASRYLAERFGGNVLYPGLPEALVQELSEILRSGDYELKPFLRKLLRSEALFSRSSQSACIISPLEQFLKIARRLPPPLTEDGESERMSFWTLYNAINATRDAGQSIFEPPTVFGWKGSCNINRAGTFSRGEGWLTAQRQLNLQQACITYLNHLNELKADYPTTLGIKSGDSAEQIASKLYYAFFWAPVPEDIRIALARFLTIERDEQGNDTPTNASIDDQYYLRRKLPRLLCSMATLLDVNRR